ncbi:tRNA pseudouridine(55) synthase TruB [Candidatus Erwinia haradaeae]|uniref:tRNA pseudouridine synthase B n=1 Tax=Candidatus Erwinia haradaeae TaxID=1922217 RepID=A0A451D333_9GAMM|nr:tRNA pseudouridine(55) synthase TruB [Candidatus Erwinia haradaeae]VFP80060.1 tRNA pseudouridine synthase B [Candidatus Erwinia haradaeae]
MKRMSVFFRNVHGVLLLDKAYGFSSNQILQQVKYLYNAKCVGHTGSLDPLATGMLPICFGESTKFSRYLLDADKHYRVIARLGQRTNTSDADGVLLSERPIRFSIDVLEKSLDCFRGEIEQIPSMYSAIKYQGRKLYEYAREGINIPYRLSRQVMVYMLRCIRYEGNELELEMRVSKGTYIRTIIDDLGEKLGCGAHVIYLRRLQVSQYPTDGMMTIDLIRSLVDQELKAGIKRYSLIDQYLLPIDTPVSLYPSVNLHDVIVKSLKQGKKVKLKDFLDKGFVRVTEGKEKKFIGLAEMTSDGFLIPRRLINDKLSEIV